MGESSKDLSVSLPPPDSSRENAMAAANRSVEERWALAAMAEEDRKLAAENWRDAVRNACPACNTPLTGSARLCPACGAPLPRFRCVHCGKALGFTAGLCRACEEQMQTEHRQDTIS